MEDVLVEIEKLSEKPESRKEARELCFKLLSEDAEQHRVRLALARLFYLDGMSEFCIRELVQLKKNAGEIYELDKLLDSFGQLAVPFLEAVAQDEDEEEILIATMDLEKIEK